MVVVVHETVSMAEPVVPLIHLVENLQEGGSVLIIPINGLPPIPPRSHMIKISSKFYSQRSRHEPTLLPSLVNSNSKDPFCEGNIKRYRNSAMSQRWLATVLLHCEKGFRRVKGYLEIADVMATIEQIQKEKCVLQKAA